MNIESKKDGSNLLVALEGRLDTTAAPELDAFLEKALKGMESLTVDMEKLEYISSAGLRVLFHAQKALNRPGSVKLTHVSDILQEIFDVTGFSRILTIEK